MALATEDDLKSWMRENRTSSSGRGSDIPSYENTFKMKGVSSCLLDRIQLFRMSKDGAGNHKFKRLDMSMTAIRDKVSHAINTDELDHIFDTDGVIE